MSAAAKEEKTVPSRDFLKANTALLVWLAFLGLGGGVLALYYAQIHYMPDIEWHSLLVYLAAASIIGATVGGLEFLSLFLPGFLWAEFLVADRQLEGMLCYKDEVSEGGREPSFLEIGRHLGRPFTLVYATSHFFLPYGTVWYLAGTTVLLLFSSIMVFKKCDAKLHTDLHPHSVPKRLPFMERSRKYISSVIVRLMDFVRYTLRYLFGSEPSLEQDDSVKRLFKYVFSFALSVILSQIALFLIYHLTKEPKGRQYWTLTVICTTVVVVSNHIVATRYSRHRLQAVITSLVAASLLLFAADHFTSLSENLMALYGFGNREVSLLLTEQGGKTVADLGLADTCEPNTPNRVCGVVILSSVGSEYFFSYKDKKKKTEVRFTLPKTVVVSWQRED